MISRPFECRIHSSENRISNELESLSSFIFVLRLASLDERMLDLRPRTQAHAIVGRLHTHTPTWFALIEMTDCVGNGGGYTRLYLAS